MARTTEKGGVRGYDGGKKISGRKRHLLVDSTGLVSAVVVHEGNIADRDGARLLLGKAAEKLPRMERVWADRGYNGQHRRVDEGASWMDPQDRQAPTQVGLGGARRGAATLPARVHSLLSRRWVIERTFAWIVRNRRMRRDYEFLPETTEALIYSMLR